MPELPDLTVYQERLLAFLAGRPLLGVRLLHPFLLRTVEPPLTAVVGRALRDVGRLGKRLVLSFDDDLHLVLHLMIAGRLRWKKPQAAAPGKIGLLALDYDHGTLLLTEAGSRKRASLHVVRGAAAVAELDRGGLEVLDVDRDTFARVLRSENHTLKRSLTDPRLFSGIGNAYSDEILHRARLSPLLLTGRIDDEQIERLHAATRTVLGEWTARLRAEVGDRFPDKVTAFHAAMAVHGRYREPCPDCGAPVQRIRYARNECNYCPTCQTGGRLLADRGLSRLLREDWPRTFEELEERVGKRAKG